MSEWFQTLVIDKENPLSPRSFALFFERIMDKIKNRENTEESVHGNRVNNLRFADDINIIEQSKKFDKLQDTIDKLHTGTESE